MLAPALCSVVTKSFILLFFTRAGVKSMELSFKCDTFCYFSSSVTDHTVSNSAVPQELERLKTASWLTFASVLMPSLVSGVAWDVWRVLPSGRWAPSGPRSRNTSTDLTQHACHGTQGFRGMLPRSLCANMTFRRAANIVGAVGLLNW